MKNIKDKVLGTLVKNGLVVENMYKFQPSEKFMNTMTVMLMIMRNNLIGHDESEEIFRVIDDEDGITTCLLSTTILHYYKFHLNIESMDFKNLEELVNVMENFYPEENYLNYINKVVYGNEELINERLQGDIVRLGVV